MVIDLVNGKNSNKLKTIVYSVSDLNDLAEEIITNVLASQYRNVASYNPLKDGGLITVNGGQEVGRKLLISFRLMLENQGFTVLVAKNTNLVPMEISLKEQAHVETAGLFENADFRKGDRVLVNYGTIKEPEVYIGTVAARSTSKKLVRVEFDDGDKQAYPVDNKGTGIIGYALKKFSRRRTREIPIDLVDDYLDQDRWFSGSLKDVNKPGFTLRNYKVKTVKQKTDPTPKGKVQNKVIPEVKPKVIDVPKQEVNMLKVANQDEFFKPMLNLLSPDQRTMYEMIKKEHLPLLKVWYETEDTDFSFDFGAYSLEQSALDGHWYTVTRVGKGHKFGPETDSLKKAFKMLLAIANSTVASPETAEVVYVQYEAEDQAETFEDDTTVDLSIADEPTFLVSMYNTKMAQLIIQQLKGLRDDDYMKSCVHHFYVSFSVDPTAAVSNALYNYAQRIAGSYDPYFGTVDQVYNKLIKEYEEGTLDIKYVEA